MKNGKLTLADLKKWIRRYHKKYNGNYYNLLGFSENKELTNEVYSLFTFHSNGYTGYDWVRGNERMRVFIKGVVK